MRDILTSPRIEEMKHKRRVHYFRLSVIFIFLFILIIGLLSYFSSNNHIIIDNVVITGNHIINTQDIENNIKEKLNGKYLYLFNKANTFIYPNKQIYNDLLKSYPRIEKLSVYRGDLKTLHVDLTERMGSYLYCGPKIPEVINDVGENCYFINNDGYIFDKAPYFSGNVYFKYYVQILDNGLPVENPLMKNILSADDFHKMVRFIDGVNAIGFKSIYMEMNQSGINTIYLNHNVQDITPTIVFKNGSDLELILNNLSTAMSKKEFADEINSKYTKLQYIDLRFNNKVLYKFQ